VQVGDLVRVYNFSKRARVVLKDNEDSEAYTLGLILSGRASPDGHYANWKIQLLQYPEVKEVYSEDRLEVESASR
jgi:hypothetical protein